jgi:hypothetical protein
MNLTAVMAEVAVAGRTVSGLAVYEWEEPGRFPAGVVGLPDGLKPNANYGRGLSMISDLPFMVLVGKPHLRTAYKALSDYTQDTGSKSVTSALQNYAWTTVDHCTVTLIDFDVYSIKGVDYLAATFHLDLAGKGV